MLFNDRIDAGYGTLASPATAFASEPSLEQPEEPVNESNYYVPGYQGLKFTIVGNGVRLRKEPSLSGDVLGLFYEQDKPWVVLTGEFSSANGLEWAQVSNSSLGFGGWVDLHYIGPEKN